MLYYLLFWTLLGFIIHFYIIFGTKLLTGGPVPVSVFPYFRVLQKRNIKQSPNGMKPSRGSFLEQTQTRRLGVEFWKSATPPWDRRACPHPRGPHGAPPTYFFRVYILLWPKNIKGSHETTFQLPQPSVPVRSHLGLFRRSTGGGFDHRGLLHQHHSLSDDVWVVYHRPSGP